MRTLVVYYSLGGTTRILAQAIALKLGADIQEIHAPRYAPRLWGILRAGYDAVTGRLPPIAAPALTAGAYDLVLVGGPVWASHPATPVQAFLRREAERLPGSVGLFLTMGGSPVDKALGEMATLAQRTPAATLALRDKEVRSAALADALAPFLANLTVPAVS
jgi:menaquinone-dependent protoporphyrinogen IX oxidase